MTRTPAAARFTRVLLSVALLAAALVITGCANGNSASWKKGQSPQLDTAKQDGYYELHTKVQTVARYQLQTGEPLGFRTGSDGRVEAVAGIYSVPLNSTKAYAWKAAK
jgi:hypothetical protein